MLDGRPVTNCDGCGAPIEVDDPLFGVPVATDLFGLGYCVDCGPLNDPAEVAQLLLKSGLLSQAGRRAVLDGLLLRAPEPIRDLGLMLHGDDPDAARRLLDGRDN